MGNDKVKILIISDDAVGIALAKKLSQSPMCEKIFITLCDNTSSLYWESVDIRQDDDTALLKFVLENDINLTIITSDTALKADLVSFFAANGQKIFAPVFSACQNFVNKIKCKHFLYKIHAQTSKFGVFDKIQTAQDWLNKANFPVLVRCGENIKTMEDRLVCTTVSLANDFLEKLFINGETNVLLEEFSIGHSFTIYFITDGYSAIPIGCVGNYKFEKDGNGGIYTDGMGCYTPDYKVSDVVISRVKNVVKNALEYLDKKGNAYVGILGVECTLTGDDKFYVNDIKTGLQDYDASAVLNSVESDLVKIFMACADGLFADEYDEIGLNNDASVSVVVNSKYPNVKIPNIDLLDSDIDYLNVKKNSDGEILTCKDRVFVLTSVSSNISRAKSILAEDLNITRFDGMEYRRDIIKDINF